MAETAEHLHRLILDQWARNQLPESALQDLLQVVFGLSTTAASYHEDDKAPLIRPNHFGCPERCTKSLLLHEVPPKSSVYLLRPEALQDLHHILESREVQDAMSRAACLQWQICFVRLYMIVYWTQELDGLALKEISSIVEALRKVQPHKKAFLEYYLHKRPTSKNNKTVNTRTAGLHQDDDYNEPG